MRKQAQQYAAFVLCVGMFVAGLAVAGNEISGYTVPAGFSVYVPASAGFPPPNDAAFMAHETLTTSGMPALAADGGSDEDIVFYNVLLPESYDSSADIDLVLVMTSAGTSQSIEMDLSVGTITGEDLNNGSAPSSIVDAAIAFDFTSSGTLGVPSYVSVSAANGLIDGAAAGDVLLIIVARDSSDTSAVDAYVHGVKLSQGQ